MQHRFMVMAKTIRTNNEYQQRIVKMLNSLAGRYSRWVIWQDFITMAATAICNSVPHPQREAREKGTLKSRQSTMLKSWNVLQLCLLK